MNLITHQAAGQAETVERVQRADREMFDNLDRKIKSLERQLAMKDATIAELDLRVTSLEQTSYTGTLLWRITDVTRRRQEAMSGRTPSIYSPAFYTSKTGRCVPYLSSAWNPTPVRQIDLSIVWSITQIRWMHR